MIANVARRLSLAFLLALAVLGMRERGASACVNATLADVDTWTRTVRAAQTALDDEDPARAKAIIERVPMYWALIVKSDESLFATGREYSNAPLRRRMGRIYALAVTRAANATDRDRGFAIRALEPHNPGDVDPLQSRDPALLADWAEVHARRDPAIALSILRDLASKDLIGSAHAYAALSRLEHVDGHDDAATIATTRCKKMTKRARVCAP